MRWKNLCHLMAAVTLAAGCASTGTPAGSGQQAVPGSPVAELDREIAAAKDSDALPGLLFKRGHARLEEAERFLVEHPAAQERRQGFSSYGASFLAAIDDFTTIVERYPHSPDAPEAMYHLGVIHDYPNLAEFGLALEWYRRTVDQYPGTESARKARESIAFIEQIRESLGQGSLGVAPGR